MASNSSGRKHPRPENWAEGGDEPWGTSSDGLQPADADTGMNIQHICYGALFEPIGLVLPEAKFPDELCSGDAQYAILHIRRHQAGLVLDAGSAPQFAVLDTGTTSKLAVLADLIDVRLEGVIDSAEVVKRQKKEKTKRKTFALSINISGPASLAGEVGTRLGKVSGYLQHPKTVAEGIEYRNPQFLCFAEDSAHMQHFVGITNHSPLALRSRAADELERILGSLAEVSSDYELDPCEGLVSPLKGHQGDGVRFMIMREDPSFSARMSAAARCHTDIAASYEGKPGEQRGGIIADVMGLGKTLTVLAAILRTLPSATLSEIMGISLNPPSQGKVRTRSTLVVVPSVQLIDNWTAQIKEHFEPGALKAFVLHGPNRPHDPKLLTSFDVVLTTYATLAAENSSGVLHQLEWYRVVLDEAHWIRNSASKQFRAASGLSTCRRWCLTGTPVQNRLGDLSSLAAFLRLAPAATKVAFERQILGPLSQGGPEFATPLREYLRAFCLRRTEKILQLPASHSQVITLVLSKEERDLYTKVLEDTRRKIEASVSNGAALRCSLLFTAILRLRMLCNLGNTCGLPEPSSSCGRCATEDDVAGGLIQSLLFCPDCGRPLTALVSGDRSQNLNPGRDFFGDPLDASQAMDWSRSRSTETPTAIIGSEPHSTKLSAVVDTIEDATLNAKHIVFSYWTSTLDALSELLAERRIKYVQVDGRTDKVKRAMNLKDFQTDLSLSVLVMSVETGAVGLNLEFANHVHIVEPQWNPAVEEQAVARVLRMGQTRTVKVFRYVTKNTVEQSIVDLQRKKSRIAKFTFDNISDDTTGSRVEELTQILRLQPIDSPTSS